jgi:hypothetical protein
MAMNEIEKVKEAISKMKEAFNFYRGMARRNLEVNNDTEYWHWQGIAEGTRRSWELLEELFNIQEET